MFLEEIVAAVDRRATEWERELPAIRARAEQAPRPRPFREALLTAPQQVGVIAECKHRSPSKGWLTPSYDPVGQARRYQALGASAISVLTEPEFFAGDMEHLASVRAAVNCPVLCKDFVRRPVQVWQARSRGADAVLLIVRIIDDRSLFADLFAMVSELGMQALVEVHSAVELERALTVDPLLIGINNRDLDTFETRLEFSHQMAARIPSKVTAVSESGIQTAADVLGLRRAGYRAVLVGESLMRGGRLLEDLRS